jgi:hypothetical protein
LRTTSYRNLPLAVSFRARLLRAADTRTNCNQIHMEEARKD